MNAPDTSQTPPSGGQSATNACCDTVLFSSCCPPEAKPACCAQSAQAASCSCQAGGPAKR